MLNSAFNNIAKSPGALIDVGRGCRVRGQGHRGVGCQAPGAVAARWSLLLHRCGQATQLSLPTRIRKHHVSASPV